MKDNFSSVALQYSQFRPTYPPELFDFIMQHVNERDAAWDCGTGNGQIAAIISRSIKRVYATDISNSQIEHAINRSNIIYSVQPAEATDFPAQQFDLVTVGQAIHWFNFDAFYQEVYRTLKSNGIIAIVGYGLIQTNNGLNDVIKHFFKDVLGEYWDKERTYIDELYKTIPFPFDEITCPSFSMEYDWNIEQLIGYLNTWSAVTHFKKKNNQDPVELIFNDIKAKWQDEVSYKFYFPVLTRLGKKK